MKILISTIKLLNTLIFISVIFPSMLWAIDLPHNLKIDKKILQGNNNEELTHNLGIQGYSPVSYFEKNKAEMGLSQFSTEYKGKIYWLTSKDQVRTFNKNPKQYIPTFEAFCPYALALGRKVGIDPTNFKIVAGQLLLFHRTDEVDALKAFNESANQAEILRRARKNYLSLDF